MCIEQETQLDKGTKEIGLCFHLTTREKQVLLLQFIPEEAYQIGKK